VVGVADFSWTLFVIYTYIAKNFRTLEDESRVYFVCVIMEFCVKVVIFSERFCGDGGHLFQAFLFELLQVRGFSLCFVKLKT